MYILQNSSAWFSNFFRSSQNEKLSWNTSMLKNSSTTPFWGYTDEYRYLQALAMFYIRLTFSGVECYRILEPFLNDYRKLRHRSQTGFTLTYIDEYVDSLLHNERVCDIALPRIPIRFALEETEELEPRVSLLGSEIDSDEEKDEMSDGDDNE